MASSFHGAKSSFKKSVSFATEEAMTMEEQAQEIR
jgi:hypothetical protein